MRWMELGSVIQSEVSQKEKSKYSMLTHIYGIRGKKRIKTQTYWRMDLRIQGGGRVCCGKVREWHGHIYTTKHKIDS